MTFNLYPMKNLMKLSQLRAVFLHDLFTHKEIDICGHIYHLLVKCIRKMKFRMILPCSSLIMSLFSKAMVKLTSGLPVLSKEDLISTHTMTRSKAHIPGQEREAGEGGNIEVEIDWFTLGLEDIP